MAGYIERDFKEAYKMMKERALDAEHDRAALVKALAATLCELSHCATQLAARGLPGREGDSVSRAQQAARDILAVVGNSQEPASKVSQADQKT